MLLLVLGLALFFAAHAVPVNPPVRAGLSARLGEGPYKLAFSAASAAGLALIVVGYAALQGAPAQNPQLWVPPGWTRHAAFTLMLPVFVLLVAAYVPSRIRTLVGHPMLVAVKIWAFAHLLANGDLASVVLFGGFLAWAVVDRISVKRRGANGPLGEARARGIVGDVVVIGVGLALYAAMLLWGHRWLIGVPLVG